MVKKFFMLITCIAVFLYAGNNWLQVNRYNIEVENLPASLTAFKIVHISDLHGKSFGEENRRLVKLIKKEAPDLIICSGDMINSSNDNGDAFIALLEGLESRFPIYCSLGNHEQMVREHDRRDGTDRYESFSERACHCGAIILDNEKAFIDTGTVSINIYGMTSRLYHYSRNDISRQEGIELAAAFITEKLGNPQPNSFNILLAHNPKWFNSYAEWDPELVLSGHIHGGVMRIPFKGGFLSPDITFFPPYDAGIYKKENTIMHVSRGLGNSVIPFRIFNRPEVAVLILTGV